MSSRPANGDNPPTSTSLNEGIQTLPDPTTLRSIITEFPTHEEFNTRDFYYDPKFNGWYPLLEKYIETIMDQCDKYSLMHAVASKLYNKRNQFVTISLIVITFSQGMISLLPTGESLTKVSVGFLALIGIAVASLNKVMKFSERAHIHRISSDKFMKLQGTIAEQLLLPFDKRYNGVEFERWARNTFFTVKELAPYPDKRRAKRAALSMSRTRNVPSQHQPTSTPIEIPIPVEGESSETQIPLEPISDDAERIAQYRQYLQDSRGRAIFKADPTRE